MASPKVTMSESDASVVRPECYIRPMALSDVDAVAELESQIFTTPWSRKTFVGELTQNSKANAYVVVHKNEIIAYTLYWLVAGEAHLALLAVKMEERTKGIGSFLLNYVLRRMTSQKVESVHLEVRESNAGARRFYEKHGFQQVGLRKNYYQSDRENAILMSRFV